MRVFLMGGTGSVGSRLIPKLKEQNYDVALLTRRPDEVKEKWGGTCDIIGGDPKVEGEWMDAVDGCDAVVNLTGEGLFNSRWTESFKNELRASRIQSTENVVKALIKNPQSSTGGNKVLVNSSAIGYYGPRGDEILDESSSPGDDFSAQLCIDWEKAAQPAAEHNHRVVCLRTGIVLDKEGVALKQMMLPFKMFVGGPVGSGRQYMSWIHHADEVGIILLALQNDDARGPINATAPNPVTNKEFSKALGRAMGRPSFMPAPAFGLRLMLGQAAEVVTQGQRVLPKAAQDLGYTFEFPDVDAALQNILGK